ncbi:probable serine/threonine-protein phosphatase 2A regulatory subunit B'' subunit TON2 [Tanacetum coccineum]
MSPGKTASPVLLFLVVNFLSEMLFVFHFLIAYDEHLRRGKSGNANAREMDFESFLDYVLALENKDSPEGSTSFNWKLRRGVFKVEIDVHQKWIEGGNYELCIEDVQDEIWDMVKQADPLRITLSDLLSCK